MMIKIRRLLCKLGIHKYQFKGKPTYEHIFQVRKYGWTYKRNLLSLIAEDKCIYCGKAKEKYGRIN